MNKPTSVWLHKFIAQHTLSRAMGFLADQAWGPITHRGIRAFIRRYNVNMQEAAIEDYRAYPTFNAFFTRHLKTGVRPLATETNAIISPVDGAISEIGEIADDQILQAKGCYYSVASLLADKNHAKAFHQGRFLTAYLAPKDYHRIHMPIDGRLLEMVHVPGRLFSVNSASVQAVPQLFARNERVICLFETAVGPMAMVMVGAMIVGSISTAWHGVVTPPTKRAISVWNYREENKEFMRGEEVGYFKLGSTVILLFAKDSISWEKNYQANSVLRFGEKIGSMI
jgi:phosphatidylserine decarboxylase